MSLNHLVAPQLTENKISVSVKNLYCDAIIAPYSAIDTLVSNTIFTDNLRLGSGINPTNRVLTLQPSTNQVSAQVNPYIFSGFLNTAIVVQAWVPLMNSSAPKSDNSSTTVFLDTGNSYNYNCVFDTNYPTAMNSQLYLGFEVGTDVSLLTIEGFDALTVFNYNIKITKGDVWLMAYSTITYTYGGVLKTAQILNKFNTSAFTGQNSMTFKLRFPLNTTPITFTAYSSVISCNFSKTL